MHFLIHIPQTFFLLSTHCTIEKIFREVLSFEKNLKFSIFVVVANSTLLLSLSRLRIMLGLLMIKISN